MSLFQGDALRVERLPGDLAELCFDRRGESVNKFDARTLQELQDATAAIAADATLRGLLVTSAKDSFIVGADIFEFTTLFARTADEIAAVTRRNAALFTAFEDLPLPIVTAINGLALGGGLEMALAADYRVMSSAAQIGLPEVTLGIFPGYGGTVRLPRLVGVATALEWIGSGKPQQADTALAAGSVDALAAPAALRDTALARLQQAVASGDWRTQRPRRRAALAQLDAVAVERARAEAAPRARHYPAPLAAIELIAASALLARDAALEREAEAFGRIARTRTAGALVQLFINEQLLKKKARAYTAAARRIERAAVLGAGIMGGGIAYTSAVRGTPVLLKDIAQPALDLGLREATKLLQKQVDSGRMSAARRATVLQSIEPTLDYAAFDGVDAVVEAVVENLKVKKAVLADVEQRVKPDAVLASNTSSLSIAELASVLARPENFVGMHFFNPVPVMPLVEVIRGPRTSDVAAATIAGYAVAMGKTPVVVKDGPGFLVNRILTANFVGFLMLLRDGADFMRVDQVMEAFGWPMGPAYLQDVIGMDTSEHVIDYITAGYRERLALDFRHAIQAMVAQQRYGQKNGAGFYRYEADARGRPQKRPDAEAQALVAQLQPQGRREFSDDEIIDRMMLPMIIEAALCLEEGMAETAAEIDMSLILGVGFPRHHGGALKYADLVGLGRIVDQCAYYAALAPCYAATPRMTEMARQGSSFHAR